MAVEPVEKTTSGVAYVGKCLLHSVLIGGMDGSNDLTVTVFDNASAASGKKLLPTAVYDATALGLNGVTLQIGKNAQNGIYVEMTTSGTGSVVCDIEG